MTPSLMLTSRRLLLQPSEMRTVVSVKTTIRLDSAPRHVTPVSRAAAEPSEAEVVKCSASMTPSVATAATATLKARRNVICAWSQYAADITSYRV